MEYKQTAEYAYDLITHFYNLRREWVQKVGKDNVKIVLPTEIYHLLGKRSGDNIVYPVIYNGMELEPSDNVSNVIFCYKD